MSSSHEILVLYYSVYGHVEKLAEYVARGVEQVDGACARIRTVPPVAPKTEVAEPPVPEKGAVYASHKDLENCAGLVLGSPTRFGNMAAAMKYFWDGTSSLWLAGTLVDKPAGFFTSTSSIHGGQETTLTSMMTPLLHHGCLIVGVPYTEPALSQTKAGGTPYGASHVDFMQDAVHISDEEKAVCMTLGRRVAELALKLR